MKEERLFEVRVPEESAGERLDKALAQLVSGLSRGEARRLIDAGCVYVDRRRTRQCGRLVVASETLTAYRPAQPFEGAAPEVMATAAAWILLDKPVGMPVEPTRQGVDGTLVAWAKDHVAGGVYVAHRLDVATSGLILLARTKAALAELNSAFAQRLIDRTYLAAVSPSPDWEQLTLEAPLDGKTAVTHARVLTRGARASLLHLTLETGRTNQIRRHLADVGHPVAGDKAFGGVPAARLLLHAAELSWKSWPAHPPQHFQRPPGPDFQSAAQSLGLAIPSLPESAA